MRFPFVLRDRIVIEAPVERCFLLSTSVEIVESELRMRPVEGRTSGLVTDGDTVRWEGRQLGLPQYHVSVIEAFRPGEFFRDRMLAGRFARFEHDHSFTPQASGGVLLEDEVRFAMPFGWAGWLVVRLVLVPHIYGLMRRRFARLKRLAEGDGWRRYLPGDAREEAAGEAFES